MCTSCEGRQELVCCVACAELRVTMPELSTKDVKNTNRCKLTHTCGVLFNRMLLGLCLPADLHNLYHIIQHIIASFLDLYSYTQRCIALLPGCMADGYTYDHCHRSNGDEILLFTGIQQKSANIEMPTC